MKSAYELAMERLQKQSAGAHFVKVAMTDVGPGVHSGFVEVAARFLATATCVGSCPALARPAAGK